MSDTRKIGDRARRLRAVLVERFGGRCAAPGCGATERLEFAHVAPTRLAGQGRGRWDRLLDVVRHTSSYVLLCHSCHRLFDRGGLKLDTRAHAGAEFA